MTNLDELLATAAILRAPGGCPWDAEQTHQSLVQYLLEETYELIEAIETNDRAAILEELGDVLYQVVFHSDLASTGSLGEPFDIQDVAAVTTAKMRGRHPHVFGNPEELERFAASTGDEVMVNWEAHKAREKPERSSVLDGIPQNLPALALASKVIGKAHKLGVLDEAAPAAIAMDNEAELGGLLLAICAAARANGLDPERALRESVRGLQAEMRQYELESAGAFDAGIIGTAE
jgi:XTP/dITP diphosphohydrolase